MLCRQSAELGDRSVVSLIPARGGSKGIPRKNLALAGGKSLLRRAIETCRASRLASTCYVSTEDMEIAVHAVGCGANLIARPEFLATDEATSCAVLQSALDRIYPRPDILAFIQCTAPFLRPEEIDGCILRLIQTGAAVAVAAAPFHGMICTDGCAERAVAVNWNYRQPRRRQEMPLQWVIAGSVWAIDVPRFLSRQSIYCDDMVIYEVPMALDIDEPEDLAMADKLLSAAATSPPAFTPVTMRDLTEKFYYPQ